MADACYDEQFVIQPTPSILPSQNAGDFVNLTPV